MKTNRNLKEYVFDFIMLFLAVTLSFFVENIRDDLADRSTEEKHVSSLLEDLKQDTATFHERAIAIRQVIAMSDSVVLLLNQPQLSTHGLQRLYFLARSIAPLIAPLALNDRTYDEMRNSGALRLVRNEKTADMISRYYFSNHQLAFINQIALDRAQKKIELEARIFKSSIFATMVNTKSFAISPPAGSPMLNTDDSTAINEYAIMLHYISSVSAFSEKLYNDLEKRTVALISTLQKEYKTER